MADFKFVRASLAVVRGCLNSGRCQVPWKGVEWGVSVEITQPLQGEGVGVGRALKAE